MVGEESDIPLIQAMGIRLLAGQTPLGGWNYSCLDPGPKERKQLADLLQQHRPPSPPPPPPMMPWVPPLAHPMNRQRAHWTPQNLAPLFQAQLERIKEDQMRFKADQMRFSSSLADNKGKKDNPAFLVRMGDNSNTQFALLGLWAAHRYGVPVDFALKQAEKRFRTSQNGDGGWGYRYHDPTPTETMHNFTGGGTNTCAGLLALAAVYGIRVEEAQRLTLPYSQLFVPQDAQVGLMIPVPGQDPAVHAGFRLLRTTIGFPLRLELPEVHRTTDDYYLLWSVERVVTIYDLKTIGDLDWYSWGAGFLLALQGARGGWTNGQFNEGSCDTSFALLFLSRANLAHDLTRTLQGQAKDLVQLKSRDDKAWTSRSKPDRLTRTLQGQRKDQVKLKSGGTEFQPGKDSPGLRGDGKTSPTLSSAPDNSAAALTAILVKTTGKKQEQALEQLREGKGAAYTEALAQAIPRLEGTVHKKAREALAERLARMTITTLGDKLMDQDLEVRRAAVLACAMRDDQTHCDKVINLLLDPEPPVARAAHAALKSLSGQDFGPTEDAKATDRTRAVAAWKDWWKEQGPK